AASSVAADKVFRPQRLAGGQLDIDAAVVLRETCHFTSAIYRHRQFVDPAGEYALDMLLHQRESVIVPGGKIADVQMGPCERSDLGHAPLRKETISDAALVEDLDGT